MLQCWFTSGPWTAPWFTQVLSKKFPVLMNQYLLFFVRIWLTLISKWQTCATKMVPFHFSGSFNFFHTHCIVGFLVIICWNRQSNCAVQCCLKRCKTFLGFAISHSLFHLSSVLSLSLFLFVFLLEFYSRPTLVLPISLIVFFTQPLSLPFLLSGMLSSCWVSICQSKKNNRLKLRIFLKR